jgi:hypothetical protein
MTSTIGAVEMPGFAGKVSECLRSEIESHVDGLMVIHAGHFAIDSAGGAASDHLNGTERLGGGLPHFMGMTAASWEMACEAIQRTPDKNVKLMVLANDWQFLLPHQGNVRERKRQAARVRREYYDRTPGLPHYHWAEMQRRGLHLEQVLHADAKHVLFSESELRQQLQSSLDPFLHDNERAEKFGLRKHFSPTGEPIVDVESDFGGRYCLLFCGSTGCAGEVVELLHQLQLRNVTRFINLYPFPCREPVITGTGLARQLFQIESMRIINVALPLSAIDYNTPASIEVC